jgi:hypothetical protein
MQNKDKGDRAERVGEGETDCVVDSDSADAKCGSKGSKRNEKKEERETHWNSARVYCLPSTTEGGLYTGLSLVLSAERLRPDASVDTVPKEKIVKEENCR